MQKTEAQNSNNMHKSIPLSEAELLNQQIPQQLALHHNSDDEIDLSELWRAIWSGKILIFVISFIFVKHQSPAFIALETWCLRGLGATDVKISYFTKWLHRHLLFHKVWAPLALTS